MSFCEAGTALIPKAGQRHYKNTNFSLKCKHNDPKPMGYCRSNHKREVYTDTSLPQETRKIPNKQSSLRRNRTRKIKNKLNPKIEESHKD